MQECERLSDDEREAEALLGRLRAAPPTPNLTAHRVQIEAERRRGRGQLWAWRGVAAALAAGLVLEVTLRPAPRAEPVPVPAPAVATDLRTNRPDVVRRGTDLALLTGDDYIATRNRSVAFGARPIVAPASNDRPTPAPGSVQTKSVAPNASPLLLQLLGGWGTGGRS